TGTGNSGKPDLQLVSFDPPTTMLHENTYNISATITNAGTVATTSAFDVGIGLQSGSSFYASSFNYRTSDCIAGNPSYTNCGAVQVASLAAGASTTLSIPLIVGTNQTIGINYLGIHLDSNNTITETDEFNNYGTSVSSFIKQVTISEWRPDITIVSFSPSSPLTRGSTYNISVTIANTGNRDATSAFQIGMGLQSGSSFYASSFNYRTSDCIAGNPSYTNCGAVQVASLAAGASTTISIPLKVNASQTIGTNYIGIHLDSGSNLTEPSSTGESNNYGTAVGTHIKQVTVN
ncbi:MAG TPA: CARDB domain-containing protein, partial [Leptospiraceae bacterium]|nr:CARDB domain-containing protein [Leptospiraceae bacterium]